MAQDFSSFYKSGAPNLFRSTTFNPGNTDIENLWSKVGKYTGIDFTTGKTVDLALEELKKQYGSTFPPVPSVAKAASLAPTDLDIQQYVKLNKALQPDLLDTQLKQNVLGLGAATAFGAASLPFTEYMRNQDYNRQLAAFQAREQSPTAQAARNLSGQQQLSLASSATADKMRAYGDLKRSVIEPLRRRA